MKAYIETLNITGSLPGGENPLPALRSFETEKPLSYDDSFLKEDKVLFGAETGFRILPYRMQDVYGRDRTQLELKSIILENEHLQAVFLPEYGGRLSSLTEKDSGRELLFKNPVFQPANLAQRDAWYSGGIEWNIGRFGHTVFTCSPLFFAKLIDDDGNEFLRAWEYERVNRTFFSMDFHLPGGAKQLAVHVRIINDNPHEVPMYWWTNTAVREEKNVRILSSTEDVLYIKPESNRKQNSIHEFGRGTMTDLGSLPGKDPSYPQQFDFSSEYFFQTQPDKACPWEAAAYDDGFTFFEKSTAMLRYRKMFCWGMHKGGRHWCDYLSEPGKGDYLEIQAGLAPSQVHGLMMPGASEWSFTEFFGAFDADPGRVSGDWDDSSRYIESVIDGLLPDRELELLDEGYRKYSVRTPIELLHSGSGWGALEARRREADDDDRKMPTGLLFENEQMESEQSPWLGLLNGKPLTELTSWMTDPNWEARLQQVADSDSENPLPLLHLGLLYHEEGRTDDALRLWIDSLRREDTALARRNIAMLQYGRGNTAEAVESLRRAFELEQPEPSAALTVELIGMLCKTGGHAGAWELFEDLPDETKTDEKIAVAAAEAASELGNDDYLHDVFGRPLAYIKEGETKLVEYWYRMQARRIAAEKGVDAGDAEFEEARKNCPPPAAIDFMMV